MLTESVTIPLEGEQALVFQGLDAEEQKVIDALAPIRAKREAMVSVILAGRDLLRAVQSTPGVALTVTPEGGIVVNVPPLRASDAPPLMQLESA